MKPKKSNWQVKTAPVGSRGGFRFGRADIGICAGWVPHDDGSEVNGGCCL